MRIPRRRFNIPKPNVAFYTDGVSYFKIYSNRYIIASPDSLTITAGDEDLPSTDGLSKSNQEEFLKWYEHILLQYKLKYVKNDFLLINKSKKK